MSPVPEDAIRYEVRTSTVARGTEARFIAKWEKEGWEFVSRSNLPLLRTQLAFRRVKPKPPWRTFAVVAGVLVVLGGIITVMTLLEGRHEADTLAATTSPTSASPTSTPTRTAEPSTAPVAAYVYEGPSYEIVAVDKDQGPAHMSQYWVFIGGLNVSTEAFKDDVKLVVADIVRFARTDHLFIEIVVDREIALAESPSTFESFIAEHGTDYAVNTIPTKEPTGWVASYSGGFDWYSGQPSQAETAFEILWWPAGAEDSEAWRPDLPSEQ